MSLVEWGMELGDTVLALLLFLMHQELTFECEVLPLNQGLHLARLRDKEIMRPILHLLNVHGAIVANS